MFVSLLDYIENNPRKKKVVMSKLENAPAVGKSDEHSDPDRRARIRVSPGVSPPCTLMTPGACKIRRGYNLLQVYIKIKSLGVPKRWSHSLCGGSKL